MIALDIDGTLLDYNYVPRVVGVNNRLVDRLVALSVKSVALCSNQSGLPFGVQGLKRRDGRPYPAPAVFNERLGYLIGVLAYAGIQVVGIQVCVYHPKATAQAIQDAARLVDFQPGLTVYIGKEWRKPSPAMLLAVCASEFYGDSDEDEQAANAAGIPFVRVGRFDWRKE